MNGTICSAISERKVIQFNYHGFNRTVEPFCHGISKKGKEVLRGYQTGGESSSGKPLDWRLFDVAEVMGLTVSDETFTPDRYGYNPADSAMTSVHCHV